MAAEITADGITVPLTHPDKVLFPGEEISKADLAQYYADVAGVMLPWLRDRPATVGKEGGQVEHVVCDKAATLVYLANQACIEIHAFYQPRGQAGRTRPDGVRFRPAGRRAVRRWASEVLARRHPDAITTEQRKDKRGMRIYADVMRNAYAQTVVASYGLRARPGAAAAVPLSWDEVEDSRLDPRQFTMKAVRARLDSSREPWAAFAGSRRGLGAAGKRLARLER